MRSALTWLRRNLGSMPLVLVLRYFLGLAMPARRAGVVRSLEPHCGGRCAVQNQGLCCGPRVEDPLHAAHARLMHLAKRSARGVRLDHFNPPLVG
jgi:hypothetical protein